MSTIIEFECGLHTTATITLVVNKIIGIAKNKDTLGVYFQGQSERVFLFSSLDKADEIYRLIQNVL